MTRENMSAKAGAGKTAPVPFPFEGSQLVRAIVDGDGEPWFVGADICRVLGLGNPNQALTRLDDDERSTLIIEDGALGGPARIIISEAGVYRLVFTSRKESAERFKRWLAHDVLPIIRKTGRYEDHRSSRINTAALNAINDTVREVRRCQGPRAAAKALPGIYALVGLTIEPAEHPQGELALAEKPEPTEEES
jgi:prophage antirepressor-like protein